LGVQEPSSVRNTKEQQIDECLNLLWCFGMLLDHPSDLILRCHIIRYWIEKDFGQQRFLRFLQWHPRVGNEDAPAAIHKYAVMVKGQQALSLVSLRDGHHLRGIFYMPKTCHVFFLYP